MSVLIPVFLYILHTSVVAGVFIVLLMVFKRLLFNRIAARVLNIIWLLIFLRLLMPFQLPNPFVIVGPIPEKLQLINNYTDSRILISSYQSLIETDSDSSAGAKEENFELPPAMLILFRIIPYIWIAGCAILLLSSLAFIGRFKTKLKASQEIFDSDILGMAEQCCRKLRIKRKIPIYTHALCRSPAVSGIIHQAVYLPEDIKTWVNADQLQHILLHELAHCKRGDPVINLLSMAAAIIHWFNPLVWLAVREMRRDREVACDALVMETLGEAHAGSYGMTILDLSRWYARMPGQAHFISFNKNIGQVERRIKMIGKFKSGTYKLSIIAITICLVVGVVIFADNFRAKPSLDAAANLLGNEQMKDKLVIIDPGHGGDDFGAVYPFNENNAELVQIKEKDINLDISLKLYELLKKSGLKVKMTRMNDRNLILDERIKMANDNNAALILSIHVNNSNDEGVNGTSTSFYAAKDQPNTALTSEKLAVLLQKELIKQLPTQNLGVKKINTRLLKEADASAAMVDVAFLSNEADREKISDEGFREQAAQAIYDGVIAALNELTAAKAGMLSR